MYSSDERACTCPVQRALKSTSMMPGAGLLSPQSKFTSGSSREWCGAPLTSKLLKYSPASPAPSPGGSRMGAGGGVGVGVFVGVRVGVGVLVRVGVLVIVGVRVGVRVGVGVGSV